MASRTRSNLVLAAWALLALGGCANDGGAKAKQSSVVSGTSGAPSLVIADRGNNRLVVVRNISGQGWREYSAAGKLAEPSSVAVDSNGRFYVTERNGSRLIRLDGITGSGYAAYGTAGSGQGQFQLDQGGGVAVDKNKKIYIADTGNKRIVRIDDLTGNGWVQYPPATGTPAHSFERPSGIWVDAAGRIFVADRSKVVRMDSIDGTGWIEFGSPGTGASQFGDAVGVTTDLTGRLYVADAANDRIARFDNMSGFGWITVRGFNQPRSISIENSGRLTVADSGSNRIIQVENLDKPVLTAFGRLGTGVGELTSPSGAALNSEAVSVF